MAKERKEDEGAEMEREEAGERKVKMVREGARAPPRP